MIPIERDRQCQLRRYQGLTPTTHLNDVVWCQTCQAYVPHYPTGAQYAAEMARHRRHEEIVRENTNIFRDHP